MVVNPQEAQLHLRQHLSMRRHQHRHRHRHRQQKGRLQQMEQRQTTAGWLNSATTNMLHINFLSNSSRSSYSTGNSNNSSICSKPRANILMMEARAIKRATWVTSWEPSTVGTLVSQQLCSGECCWRQFLCRS